MLLDWLKKIFKKSAASARGPKEAVTRGPAKEDKAPKRKDRDGKGGSF
ncbi:MAG: hypothetical protein IJU99_08985 [Lachnospiraceae bacterium]|nr:hypothetical protein [Lachnospiraceae bacterium]MBR0152399.1 hypothetical protein [Lachnospiraceae bacterium]